GGKLRAVRGSTLLRRAVSTASGQLVALGGHATVWVEGTGLGCVGGVMFTPDPQKLWSHLS
ncbi:hypothetical protein, partial [Streptomyces glaucescens]|uniref:hypothetical protein n=1 Tax=Streptomyces glaucescens TaxID=1907 RepID=UPI001B809AC1